MINECLINGPNNVVRLSNGDKILYIFADFHFELNEQFECELNDNYDSIDIDKLLFKFMKEEKKKEFDIFIESEIFDSPEIGNVPYRFIYINQMRKLVYKNIIIKNDKMLINKKYNNFRFHYSDIRDTIEINFDNFKNISFPPKIFEFENMITESHNIINSLTNYIKNNKNNKIIFKILHNYENKKIQKIINKIYNDIFIKNANLLIKNCKELINLINQTMDQIKYNFNYFEKYVNITKDIYIKYKENINLMELLFVIITDLYFLRRFLDKKYIENSILYTGAGHMINLIYLLIKYFNYELTHTYYISKPLNKREIVKITSNKLLYFDELKNYFYKRNEYYEITQCCNLFNFPKNFS